MSLVEAVLIGLGAWRLTALLSYEVGPGQVFKRIRSAMGIKHDAAGEPKEWPSGFITDVIACPWCLGLWAAAGTWALWEYISEAAVIVLAAGTVLIAIERWNHR